MYSAKCFFSAIVLVLLATPCGLCEDVLFDEKFEGRLSDRWEVVGFPKTDYRVRDGGLEVRVQPGELSRDRMVRVVLPFTTADEVIASVKVTMLDEFTQDGEFAGLYLLDEDGPEFGAKKQRVGGKLVFAPGNYVFKGQPGGEGDPANYTVNYTAASDNAGPLRIITRGPYAYFQVGPSADDKFLNFFHSAVNPKPHRRGFCLVAAGAPKDANHWVRFDDFRVVR